MIDTKAIVNTSGRIKDAIALKHAELDIVYGRRRIGKNTIIVKALSRKEIYILRRYRMFLYKYLIRQVFHQIAFSLFFFTMFDTMDYYDKG
jgi:AAA+ ATPase superfamily predicted ATPase